MSCSCFGGSRLEKKKSSANSHQEIDGKDLNEQSLSYFMFCQLQ